MKSIQNNLFGFDKNRNNYYSYTNKGGALLAKYSYKKLSQNEAEFIPDECLEYQTPIIKTGRRTAWDTTEAVGGEENTDDDIEEETNNLSSSKSYTANSVSSMSCSESTTTACFSDSATQYCSRDTDTEDMLPDYDFSVHYPVSLREEDCDWDDEDVTCNVCDRSFPTPVHLDAHMVKYRHWLCGTCDKLFNSVIQLEYHKDSLGHWSDEYETDTEDSGDEEDNYFDNRTITHAIIEQETSFGPNGDKNILMCHQFWNNDLQ